MHRRFLFLLAAAATPSALIVACGSRTGLLAPQGAPDAANEDARPDVSDALPPLDVSKKDVVVTTDCPDADSTLVYAVAIDDELLSFYPPTATFKTIGLLSCPASDGATPFSMAVDRKGTAYVEYDDGSIFRVSTQTAACTGTSFQPQGVFSTFGMGYATIGAGPDEALFLASEDGHLGTLDTTTFHVTSIGAFAPLSIQSAELSGTGDGRLYAYYASGNSGGSAIAEIDKTTAKVLGADALTFDRGDAWAFAFWGGDFWVFTAPSSEQATIRYDPSDKSSTVVAHYGSRIVGAGVSTCAPQ